MLVLSRYEGEEIVVGSGPDEVRIQVAGVGGDGKVRLAFAAPRGVPIDRAEVRDRKLANAKRAVGPGRSG